MPHSPDNPAPDGSLARLPGPGIALLAVILIASFITGILVWYGEATASEDVPAPGWLRVSLVTHGCLNPLVAICFGVLLVTHMRAGWELRANRPSGLLLEFTLALLILSGAGLYYLGSPEWRKVCVWLHRALGCLLPIVIGMHVVAGRVWARRQQK